MEVRLPPALALPPPPFQRSGGVQEWRHLDSVTGSLETGRVETGRWAATTSNSTHHFGQVVDLRARNRADGSQEQRRQKKQLEVFQASIPGGSVQVIRSQTTTSSWHGQSTTSSKLDSGMSFGWSHSMNNSSSQSKSIEKRTSDESSTQTNRSDDKSNSRLPDMHFDNLQLAIHPLDLSPQKTKASVGRSGSISGRRPPTRPRSIAGTGQGSDVNAKSTTIKDQQQQRWQSSSASSLISKTSSQHSETKSVFSSRRDDILNPVSLFSITGNRGDVDLFPVRLEDEGNKKKLFRMKSCSSEDLRLSPDSNHEDTDDKGGADEWRRDSLERRSLQLPPVQPRNLDKKQTNVMRSRVEAHNTTRHSFISSQPKDVEKQTVIDRLKGTGWKSIEDVLKKNFDNQLYNSRNGLDSLVDGMVSPSEERSENRSATKNKNTFITVESLNAVRGRLRRTDSFSELLPGVERSNENIAPTEQEDDGILTEPHQSSTSVNDLGKSDPKSVKSFVYGIETVLQGDRRTGSLETRGNSKIDGSNGLTSKTEEWYNRRKSYGFEPVRQQQQSIANRYSSNLNTKINLAESTDSGICRSSETVANTATPWYTPTVSNKYTTADNNNESRRTSHTITIKNSFNYDNLLSDSKSSSRIELLSKGIGSKGKRTVVTVGNEDQDNWRGPSEKIEGDKKIEKEADKFETSNGSSMLSSATVNLTTLQEPVLKDEEKEIVPRGKVADALRSLREKSSLNNSFAAKRLSEPITISIPSPVEDSENAEVNDFLLKQTKDPLETDRYKFKKFLDSETKNVQTSYSKLIFGEGKIKTMSKSFDGQADNDTPSNRFNLRPVSKINQPEFKRHSIAVDETKYITNKNKDSYELSSSVINENSNFRSGSTFVSPYASKLKPSDNGLNKGDSSGDNDSNDKKQKKVEFCKTEVHFAAEPGRFNIVETDGKPPSNMNFRRRRKTISESTPRNTSNLPEIRFGDLQYEKALLTNKPDNMNEEFIIKTIQKEDDQIATTVPKDEVITILPETIHPVSSKIDGNCEKFHSSSLLADVECDPIYDDKGLDMNVDNYVKPRSILKSNATLNENKDGQFYVAVASDDKHTSNHGIVRLNAADDDLLNKTSTFMDQKGFVKTNEIQVSRAHKSSSKTTITSDLKSRSDCEDQVETELQKLLKSLRPTPRRSLFSTDDELSDSGSNYPQTPRYRNSMSDQNSSMAADNGLAVHISSKPTWSSRSPSTAENSHKIEEYKSKGFSTRVNFGSEETMVVNSESVKKGLPKEQMSSPYSTEVASRIFAQPSNLSDNNVGVQQDGNAVSTTTHIRFNAAPDLNHRLTTNKHNNEVTVTSTSHSPLLVTSSSDNENMSSASLVLKMLLNRAAQSRRREIGTQKSDKQGIETNSEVTQRNRSAQSYIEDSVTFKKPSTTQFYTAHTSVSSINPGIKDDNYNGKDKSSPSTEQNMMKMINSQHNQHLNLIKEMDKYNGTIPEVRREEIGSRNLDVDEREERLSRISNDSILEALENLSKQIENDIIEIPKIKDVKNEVKLKNSSVFKVIEDSGETRMKRFLRRRTDSNLSQSQLSDDTLRADEEVKSYMSAVNDVRKMSDSSDSDDAASKTKNCDRLTNFNRRNRRVVKNRTKEPCTSQITQGIISQPKNKIPDDIPKGQSTAKFYSDSTNEKSHSDSTKSVETLVSTRSGHPRITSISLRYNDNHETNGAVFETPSSASKKYSRSSICIEPCDSGSSTTDISSSWKWSKGSKQSVRENVSLSNIYSNATRTIEPVSSREDITALPEDDSAAALGYPKTKPTRMVTEDYQRKQAVKSASDQCVLLSSGKPQFGKVTAVVPPTVAYSSSVVLNYQPSPTQVADNITTQHRSYQATTSSNVRRGSKSEGIEKSKVVSEQRNVGNYRKNVSVSSSSSNNARRDSWLNIPKDVSTSQVEQTRQSREVKVEKQRKKSSTAVVDVRKKKKTTDGGLVEDCSDDLMRRGRESPIYANSNVFAHDYTAPTSSDRAETESLILEELTKAADEILRAVNGYTDDDSSFRGSSDDEPGKRYGRERKFSSSKPLGTISETPTRVKSQVVETKVRSTAVKSRLCKTSSNSSVEGGGSSADSKPLMEKPSKRRNVRLLQRASSREMLMKSRGAASSSEDVQSGSEQAAPPPRVSRMKTSRHTSQHQKSTIASQSRTKERVQKTVSNGDVSGVKAQSTVISAASSRARHDARKRTTTKSTNSSASATASARRLAVGGRQSPEGAEQAVKKEAAGGESRLPQPRDEPQPRARPATANRAAAAARTANHRSSTAAAVYVPRTTSRPHYRNHARRKRRRGTAARSQHWPQCPCV